VAALLSHRFFRLQSFLLTLILIVAAWVRFYRLGRPDALVFDELYYVDGAKDLLQHGVEVTGADPEFIVHPSIGKWVIAAGIAIFGDDSFGWRVAGAALGVGSVLLIYLIAKKFFGTSESTSGLDLIPLLAAALMQSMDCDRHVADSAPGWNALILYLASFLSLLHERLLLAGIALGLATGTKWSAIYFLVALSLFVLISTIRNKQWQKLRTLVALNLLALLTYILSWIGWLISDRGWTRNSSENPLIALWNFHREIFGFHSNLDAEHNYRSHPWSWLVMGRPTSFFYESPSSCGSEQCSQEVLALGNPLLWWFATIAVAALVGYWLHRRDRISSLILASFLAGYLPWFFFPDRTMFTFYAIVILPFLILAICYLANELLLQQKGARVIIALGFAVVFAVFLYFLPINIASIITFEQWQARMWLESWI